MGHETMGEVVEVAPAARKSLKVGDRVVIPFTIICDLDNGVPLVLDPGIGYAVAADVRGAVPNECVHRDLR
jgi:threonine dehydrogenase-like Zn-dependent dehydrogenase